MNVDEADIRAAEDMRKKEFETEDQLIDNAKKDLESSSKDIVDQFNTNKDDSPVDNEGHTEQDVDDTIDLGEELGKHERVDEADVEDLFRVMQDGLIFKIDKGLFRVCYINSDKRRFTAEMVNERPG